MQEKKSWSRPLAHDPLNPPLSMGRDPQFKGESFDFINSVVVYGPFPIEILNCQCWYGNGNNDSNNNSNNGSNNVLNDHKKMKILIFSYRWIILK